MDEIKNALFSDAKNYLDITWDDEKTDEKLMSIVNRGCAKITALTNCSIDDIADSPEHQSLFLDYCRLSWAGVPEKFDQFFKNDIVRLRLQKIAEGYEYYAE